MCRFCREDQSFEETAIIGKPKLCRSDESSPGRDAGRGPASVLPCGILTARAGGLPREGAGAASGDREKADALGCRRVERAVVGEASRGRCRACRLPRVPGPFTMSIVRGQQVAWLLASEPWSRSSTFPSVCSISCKIHLVASRTSKFCPKILCKFDHFIQHDQRG